MTTHQTAPSRPTTGTAAFTLIELLTVIGIVGVLLSILLPSLGRVRDAANVTRELAAAQQLAQAYQLYADEHQGYVLPAKVHPTKSPKPILDDPPQDEQGNPPPSASWARWFWRLAPYLDFNYEVLYRDEDLLPQVGQDGFSYAVTVNPGFGINYYYVGGRVEYYDNDNYVNTWGRGWWIERITDARRPSQLFAFVSSAEFVDSSGQLLEGYFKAKAPYFVSSLWQYTGQPTPETNPNKTGWVRPIANQTVVTAMLDGHAEALPWDEVKDMRHWAPKADSPDWHMEFPLP